MFYEKNEIESSLLNCAWCSCAFDAPYRLSCGEIICNRCLTKINAQSHHKKFQCKLCNNVHVIPQNGFPIDKRLANLLEIKPKPVYRGVEIERAQKSLNEIKDTIEQFYQDISEIKEKIKVRCDELRKKAETDAKQAIEEHETRLQDLLNEIDTYEMKCFESLNYESHDHKIFSQFLKEASQHADKCNEILNKANLNQNEIHKIENATLNLKISLMSEFKILKSLFSETMLEFSERDKDPNTQHFGRLVYNHSGFEMVNINELVQKDIERKINKLQSKLLTFNEFSSILLTPCFHLLFNVVNSLNEKYEYIRNKYSKLKLKLLLNVFGSYSLE